MSVQWGMLNSSRHDAGAHMMDGYPAANDDQSQQYTDELLWLKGKGKGSKGKDKGKGKGKDVAPICANCGGKGHTIQQCKEKLKPWSERPCHRCGKPGHLSVNCPTKNSKGTHLAESDTAQPQTPKTFQFNMLEVKYPD